MPDLLSDSSIALSGGVVSKAPLQNSSKVTGPAGSGTGKGGGQPGKEDEKLKASLKKVDAMIEYAREKGGDAAADNLAYWRSGKGGTKTMPASWFKNESFVIERLRYNHRGMFQSGAEKRLKGQPDQMFPATTLTMLGGEKKILPAPNELLTKGVATLYYEDSVRCPNDHLLYYALGGFTVYSEVVLRAEKLAAEKGGGWNVTFVSWKTRIYDYYDWDQGKITYIPGFGDISDEELLTLERAGYGKAFRLLSEQWDVSDQGVLDSFRVAP